MTLKLPSPDMFGRCPICGEKQHCPCSSCSEKHDDEVVTWIIHNDTETHECGHCGFTEHMDWWQDYNWKCHQLEQLQMVKYKLGDLNRLLPYPNTDDYRYYMDKIQETVHSLNDALHI